MIEMKQETTHDNEETYMMIENFINMVEKLKNTPKNKFRKVAEKELELILEEIETICQIKEFELNDYSMYYKMKVFRKLSDGILMLCKDKMHII